MSIKVPAFLRQLLSISALALISTAFLSSCQSVNTSTVNVGDWALSSEFSGNPRTQAASFVININGTDVVYVGGGYNGTLNVRDSDWYKFDETNGTWYKIATFPGTPRNLAVGFTVNGKGYVATGYDGTNWLDDVWQYDPTQGLPGPDGAPMGKWTQMNDFGGGARYGAVAFAVGNNGYIASGVDSTTTVLKDMWIYNAAADTWSEGADLGGGASNGTGVGSNIGNDKRQNAVAFVYTNPITKTQTPYVITGVNNGTYVDDVLSYNTSTDTWRAWRKINDTNDSSYDASYGTNILRSDASVFLINDTAYLVCGNYNGVIGTTWCYDIGNDQWFQKSSFEGSAREGAIGFNINNHGYLTTGSNGNNYYDDTWQFFPDAALTSNDNY
jgi:N-acetylneuraminic acid mutarotase